MDPQEHNQGNRRKKRRRGAGRRRRPDAGRALHPALSRLESALAECTRADASRLRRDLSRLSRSAPESGPDRSSIERIEQRITEAMGFRAERESRRPEPRYDDALPVVQRRDDIAQAIRDHQVVVLCGETGSGKSTQLPKMCLDAALGLEFGARGAIAHTQPRRIAARAVASRVAEELGVKLGEEVGYKVRFESRTSAHSLVTVLTDGVLLAETRTDPDLLAYDAIIIDEAHERSLTIDFLLGYLHRLLPRRPDLRVIITSATIDPESFKRRFEAAGRSVPIIEVSGRTYPVETRYRPTITPENPEPDLSVEIADAAEELAAELPNADVLVFLPGEREIRDAANELRSRNLTRTEVLPLYARLSLAEQQRALSPGHPEVRRIVLATNVAETSLTVPGIRAVIDTGLARVSRYSTRRKVQLLPIEPVSRASANQRAGRCGRVGPGVCVRLYEEPDFLSRDEFTLPEIQRSNLASVILQMKSLNLGEPESFPFIDPPDARAIKDGYDTLLELGATDHGQNLTKLGRTLARFPVDPRIARMIIAASDEGCLDEVLVIAAALETQDPRVRPSESAGAADEAHERFADETSDFMSLLKMWTFVHDLKDKLSASKFKRACSQNFLSWLRIREWTNTHRQLRQLASDLRLRRASAPDDPAAIHRALLTGLLSSIGRKTETAEFAGPRGTRFHIHPGSGQFSTKPQWVVSAELVRTTKLYARTVARVQPEWIERSGEHLLKFGYSDPSFNRDTGRVEASERVTILGLELHSGRRVDFGRVDPETARELFIHAGLVEGELRSSAPFLRHNRKLIEQVEALEAKARRRDILADAESRFRFYDERLPPEVNSGRTLDKWRKQAERDEPNRLFMQEHHAIAGETDDITPQRFPDTMTAAGGVSIPLEYVHDPESDADGVTAVVEADELARIESTDADRVVPGLLADRVETTIRALPKRVRRTFDIAEAVHATLDRLRANPDTPISQTIADAISGLSGARVSPADIEAIDMPRHLRLNVRVASADGKVLAEGRDLADVRRRVVKQVGNLEDRLRHKGSARFEQESLRTWDVGDIPESIVVDTDASSGDILGFPALVDEGDAVALRVRPTRAVAAADHTAGVRRLFQFQARRELRSLFRHEPGFDELSARHALIGTREQLEDGLGLIACDRAFMGGAPIRDAHTFEKTLELFWGDLSIHARAAVDLASRIFVRYAKLIARIDAGLPPAWTNVERDVTAQVRALVYPGFLTATPPEWLKHLPRYLNAAEQRIDRLAGSGGGLAADAQHLALVRRHLGQLIDRARVNETQGRSEPALVRYRWLIEELRVSLFAQKLGTAERISPQRLDEFWSRLRDGRA